VKLEDERRALAAFVSKFDALGLGGLAGDVTATPPSKLRAPLPSAGGAHRIFAERQQNRITSLALPSIEDVSPARLDLGRAFIAEPSLLLEEKLEEVHEVWTGKDDLSFDLATAALQPTKPGSKPTEDTVGRDVFGAKENIPVM
jgi:centromeric protein E